MIISIGEILFDKFPDYSRIGGAPFNFAYHLHKLGQPVIFVSRVGSDNDGWAILDFLKKKYFPDDHIQLDDKYPTGYVDIQFVDDGEHEFNIIRNVAYDNLDSPIELKDHKPDLIYFGTLIQRTSNGLSTLNKTLQMLPEDSKSLCDINLRPDCYNGKTIENSLRNCDILKLNESELEEINQLFIGKSDTDDIVFSLMNTYSIDIVSLTLGETGSRLYRNGDVFVFDIENGVLIADTVGAGDAYAAILAIGYLKKWSPEKILQLASEFAADICQISGAIPEDDEFYKKYLNRLGE